MRSSVVILILITSSLLLGQVEIPQSVLELKNNINLKLETVSVFEESLAGTERKSPALAILYSALLPGMGELYAGNYNSGKYLTITEGAFWLSYFSINLYGNWQEENYLSYAKTNGGADTEGKDEDFFANIGNYRDINQYNDEQAFYRRFDEMYNLSTHTWAWSSTAERRTYRTMWVSSRQAYNNLRFVVAGMLLNRLGSIINAVRLVSAHNKALSAEQVTEIRLHQDLAPDGTLQYNVGLQIGF